MRESFICLRGDMRIVFFLRSGDACEVAALDDVLAIGTAGKTNWLCVGVSTNGEANCFAFGFGVFASGDNNDGTYASCRNVAGEMNWLCVGVSSVGKASCFVGVDKFACVGDASRSLVNVISNTSSCSSSSLSVSSSSCLFSRSIRCATSADDSIALSFVSLSLSVPNNNLRRNLCFAVYRFA